MNKRLFFCAFALTLWGGLAWAQDGQNVPVYDPYDPAARPLPPNIYMVIDVSGSMAFSSLNNSGSGGVMFDTYGYTSFYDTEKSVADAWSRMHYVKGAVQTLMSRQNVAARWSFGVYNTYGFRGGLTYSGAGGTITARNWGSSVYDFDNSSVSYLPATAINGQTLNTQKITFNNDSNWTSGARNWDYGETIESESTPTRRFYLERVESSSRRWTLVPVDNAQPLKRGMRVRRVGDASWLTVGTLSDCTQTLTFSSANWSAEVTNWTVGQTIRVNATGDTAVITVRTSSARRLTVQLDNPDRAITSTDTVKNVTRNSNYYGMSAVGALVLYVGIPKTPYIFPAADCPAGSSTDPGKIIAAQILEPIPYDASVPFQLVKSALDDPALDNRGEISEWVDNQFPNQSVANDTTGCLSVPGWNKPFLKEITGHGSTPISYALASLENYIGVNNACTRYDYVNGAYQNLPSIISQDTFVKAGTDSCRAQAVILITDGKDTCAGETAAQNAAEHLYNTYAVPVFVIGFVADRFNNADPLKASVDAIASHGGTGTAYLADDGSSVNEALDAIMLQIKASETSGDTEPILGFVPKSAVASWPTATMVDDNDWQGSFIDSAGTKIIMGLQNVVIKASTAYAPVFQGHLRMFQALKNGSTAGTIDFLTNFSQNTDGSWNNMIWDAAVVLKNKAPAARNILIFTSAAATSPVVLNSENLKSASGLTDAQAAAMESYIRKQPLGAISNSTPAFVGPPDPRSRLNQSYQTWCRDHAIASRERIVLVGADDGMLHCFKASTGEELWAIIPYSFLSGGVNGKYYKELFGSGVTAQQGQPASLFADRGVAGALKNRKLHYYYVASSPRVTDIKYNDTWKTICIFGLGGGGNEYHCLDITNASTGVTRLWSLTNDNTSIDLGESWSTPAVGRLRDETSFGVFGSGFNMTTNGGRAGQGVYIVNLATGGVIREFSIGGSTTNTAAFTEGSNTYPGLVTHVGNCVLASPTVFESQNDADTVSDKIFVSDYEGNIWRCNLDVAVTQTMSSFSSASLSLDNVFTTTNGKPVFSGVFVSEIKPSINSPIKTILTFAEYGDPHDASVNSSTDQVPGALYCLINDNLGTGGGLNDLAGTGLNLTSGTEVGGYLDLSMGSDGGRAYVEEGLTRPGLFAGVDSGGVKHYFFAASTWQQYFQPDMSGSCSADVRAHRALPMGQSRAYVLSTSASGSDVVLTNSGISSYLLSAYGRASSFHKGLRGEGWIDSGSGELKGYGFNSTTGVFSPFGVGNVTYNREPGGTLKPARRYWREIN